MSTYQTNLKTPQLDTVTLKNEVPLIISEKLQLQIKYLCQKEAAVEWSGVLFYTTEGEFGKPDFKCIAQEVLLMDIGSGAYTEYQYDTAFVSLMMKNPHLMTMKRGHIHSHNNMAVFFSGTDTSEIVENSEHYDYYLSLIVNNRNEMTAKIAFRANLVNEGVKKVYYKKVFNEAEKSSFEESYKTENECVMIYNCAIEGQDPVFGVDQKFIERYELIKKEKEVKKPTTFYSKQAWSNTAGYGYGSIYEKKYSPVDSQTSQSPTINRYYPGQKEKTIEQGSLFGESATIEEEEVTKDEAIEAYNDAVEEFFLNTCFPNSNVSSIDFALKQLTEDKEMSTGKNWEFQLKDMEQNIHWAYLNSFEDGDFKHFDETVKDVVRLLSTKWHHTNRAVIQDLTTKVFKGK